MEKTEKYKAKDCYQKNMKSVEDGEDHRWNLI